MQTSPVGTRFSCTCNQIKYNTQLQYPQSRNKHVSCLHDNFVYKYAGKDGTISLRDFWRFNIGNNTWQQVSFRGDKPSHLEGHTLVSCKKLLLLFGGEFGDALTESSLWIINPDLGYIRKSNLDPGSERPSVRRHHSAVIYRGCMFVYGGYVDMKGSSTELWQYRIDDEDWDLLLPRQPSQDIPSGLHGHSAVVYNKYMWLYGGMSNLIPKQDLWCYNFVSSRWDRLKSKYGPPPLTGHSAVVVGSQMFIFGGECNREPVNQLWCFCFKTDLWTQVQCSQHMPSARMFHSAVIVSPSQRPDSSVKASSMPYLQKKMKVMELERPRTSPSSRSQGHLHFSDMHFSDKNSRPQVLNIKESSSSCESLKIIPSPAENTKDHSPLVPKKTDMNFNVLDKSYVINGIDNPGISKSTEELVRENQALKLSELNQENEDCINVPFLRTQSQSSDMLYCNEKLYNRQNSEGFDYGSRAASKDTVVDLRAKKFRPDPDLIIEDLEYKDCFPFDIKIPYPTSRSVKNICLSDLHDTMLPDEEVETIELTDMKAKEEAYLCYNEISGPLNSQKGQNYDSLRNQNEGLIHNYTSFVHESVNKVVKNPNQDSEALNSCDTMLMEISGNAVDIQNASKLCDVNNSSSGGSETQGSSGKVDFTASSYSKARTPDKHNKVEQQDTDPYMLIFGGKEKQVSNFGIKPLSVWKCRLKKL